MRNTEPTDLKCPECGSEHFWWEEYVTVSGRMERTEHGTTRSVAPETGDIYDDSTVLWCSDCGSELDRNELIPLTDNPDNTLPGESG